MAFPDEAPERFARHSPEGQAQMARIEEQLLDLRPVKELRARMSPSTQGSGKAEAGRIASGSSTDTGASPHYLLTRPYTKYPEERLRHSLTGGSLRGPGLITVAPAILTKTAHGALVEGGRHGDSVIFMHLGRSICGHDGVVHGGAIATIFDEALARPAFYALPSNVGVTARLEVNYRKPTMADQFVRVETEITHSEGRKAYVKGQMRDMSGTLLAEAEALFVEPRFARFINKKTAKEFLEG